MPTVAINGLGRIGRAALKILLGTDFPTIPYSYREQLDGLTRLGERHAGLGEEWLRRVCWHNGVELFGAPA